MSTLTEIYTELKDTLAALPDVDEASMDGYLPPVRTRKIALVMPPMGLRGSVSWRTPTREPLIQSHYIPCEFWVKVDNGKLAECMERGREICLAAIRATMDNPTLGDTVAGVGHFTVGGESFRPIIDYEVREEMVPVGNAVYIVAIVRLPVVDFADLE